MKTLQLSIVTPNGEIFNGEVNSVTLPGKEGEFGVLPEHASLLSSLNVGVITIGIQDKIQAVAINWGYVKVSEGIVNVLVDGAVALTQDEDSDIAKSLQEAKELVNSVQDSNVPLASVEAKINSFA